MIPLGYGALGGLKRSLVKSLLCLGGWGLEGEGVVWGSLLALGRVGAVGPSCPRRAGAGDASGASVLLNSQL